jgi:hypothetical protein
MFYIRSHNGGNFMDTDGVFLSSGTLNSLSATVREAISNAVGFGSPKPTVAHEGDRPGESTSRALDGFEDLARFSERQMRQFLKPPLNPKTRKALEAIAQLEPRYRLGDLLDLIQTTWDQLRRVQSGLTKRTRRIANDDQVYLVVAVNWDQKSPENSVIQMHPDTHTALRRVLKK